MCHTTCKHMKSILRTALVLFSAFVPLVSSASTSIIISFGGGGGGSCSTNVCAIASNIIYLINYVFVPVIFAIAFVVFLYGVAKAYIFSNGEPGAVSAGHKLILWGIIGFVVMVSLWGLVNVVANAFGLTGVGAPPLPTSYPTY